MINMALIHLENENYDELIKEGIVVVDFFATWCGPCKMLGPIIEKLGNENTNVKFIKVDVDKNEDLARKKGLENKSAVNSRFDEKSFKNSGKSEKVTESNTAEFIDKSTIEQQQREVKNLEYVNNIQESELDKGNTFTAHEIQNAQETKNIANKTSKTTFYLIKLK